MWAQTSWVDHSGLKCHSHLERMDAEGIYELAEQLAFPISYAFRGNEVRWIKIEYSITLHHPLLISPWEKAGGRKACVKISNCSWKKKVEKRKQWLLAWRSEGGGIMNQSGQWSDGGESFLRIDWRWPDNGERAECEGSGFIWWWWWTPKRQVTNLDWWFHFPQCNANSNPMHMDRGRGGPSFLNLNLSTLQTGHSKPR